MSISLPVINNNMFVGLVAGDSRRPRPPRMKNASQPAEAHTGDPCLPDMANTGKTDNSPGGEAGDTPVDELPQNSDCILREKAAAGPGTDDTVVTALPRTSPAGVRQRAHALQERHAPVQRGRPDTGQTASAGSDQSVLPGHKSAVAGALAAAGTQKMQVLDDRFPQIHQSAADTERKASVGPDKSALSVEKPGDSPAPIDGGPKRNLGGAASQVFADSVHGKEQAGSQAKNRARLTSRQSSPTHFTRAVFSDNTHISVSELRSASTQPTKLTNTALPMDVSTTVSQQIMESIRGSLQQGDRSITIRLHPPELGKVVVRFQEREDQIAGSLEVSKAQTRYEIDQALPQIIQTLRDSGVRIERLDVLLTDQSERQADRDHLLQDGSFQQHYFAQGANSDDESNYERLRDMPNYSYQDDPELQVQIGDNSINMLI